MPAARACPATRYRLCANHAAPSSPPVGERTVQQKTRTQDGREARPRRLRLGGRVRASDAREHEGQAHDDHADDHRQSVRAARISSVPPIDG